MPRQPHPSQLVDPSSQNTLNNDQLQAEINQAVSQLTASEPSASSTNTAPSPSPVTDNQPAASQYFSRSKPAAPDLSQPGHLSAQDLQSIREEISTPEIKADQIAAQVSSGIVGNLTPAKIALIAISLFVIGILAGVAVVYLT